MLRQIRLLVFDLDYLIFDCAALKLRALRQSLISFADTIPPNIRLPEAIDAEEGFREHGLRWVRSLEIGLDEDRLKELEQVYQIQENRLVVSGVGRIYPGMRDLLEGCARESLTVALGAEASRSYLMAVSDRHGMDQLFEIALCTEEYGLGGADEMLGEIMEHAEVNRSETLVLSTRPAFFQASRNLDLMSVGCGWGIRQYESLAQADFQSLTLAHLIPAIRQADELSPRLSIFDGF